MALDNIQAGVIHRIHLKNFVTYDEVIVKPGRNLNLIIGANGTGKSTIVSAIVLGLGGNPKLIGRAQNVGDFVKAGQKEAMIEIDLLNGPHKFLTITRTFDNKSHTSWQVNKKNATTKQITELMKTFNIQVDNLCQFLPQDRVQAFSELNPYSLLLETERSVGDPKLLEHHDHLKELRIKQAELEQELEMKTRLQTQQKQVYDSLKDSVGHINEQRAIKKKLKTLKQKKFWITYQNKLDEFTTAKKGRDAALKLKKKIQTKLEPMETEINKVKSSISALEKTAKQHNSETSAKTGKLNKFLDAIEKCERSIDEKESECEHKVREEQDCDNRIDQKKTQKDRFENDLKHLISNVGSVESIQSQLDSTNEQMNLHRNQLNELKSEQNFKKQKIDNLSRSIRAEEQTLQEVQNIENKRYEVLSRLSNDAYKGVLWLKDNKHLFSRPVHEPMLLHINLQNPEYSKYFENIINQRDLTAFVCEDKNDMNNLVRYLRDQQKYKINAVHSDPNKDVNDQPSIPLRNIQKYGFEHYLVSLIDAPKTILNYLITMYRINEIPIGNDKVASNLEQIPDGLFRFFSSKNSYSVSRSKYTGEKSTRQGTIQSRGILSITVDAAKINNIRNKIQNFNEQRTQIAQELNNINEKLALVVEKIENLKIIRNRLQNDLANMKNLEVRINVCAQELESLQSGRRSIDEIRSEYKAEIQETLLKQLQIYRQLNKMLKELHKDFIINEEMKLQIKLIKNKLAVKENDSHDLREEFSNAERNCRLLENELAPLKILVQESYNKAKESTGGLIYGEPEFESIKKTFAKLPPTEEEINEEIQITQTKIFCLSNDDQDANRVIDRFNTAKKNLGALDQLIREFDQQLIEITEEIEKVRNEWYPMLTSLIEKINNNFSSYFNKMKCAGEVSLVNGENIMDFDKYGLSIKVKFREADELQALTRNHQSGGERAVTTAVYMIALQELTRVPFRCVDEINQGMDATNERRVFDLIVDITGKNLSSQYFLLTPKLLPNLKYHDSITVLTVFNGKFMMPCSEFETNEKIDSIIDAAVRRQAAVH